MIGMGPYDHALGFRRWSRPASRFPIWRFKRRAIARSRMAPGHSMAPLTVGAGDTNTTAQMVMALVAAGVQDETVDRGTCLSGWIANDDDGYPYQPGAESDANSTSLVIQAFIAAGRSRLYRRTGGCGVRAVGMQTESGAFVYMMSVPGDNPFATVQAIPAVAGVAFPLPAMMPVLATPAPASEATPAG